MDSPTNNNNQEQTFVKPEGKQPNVNTQKKTEDVTNTKGMAFTDFDLSNDVQLVSYLTEKWQTNLINHFFLNLGYLRDGLRSTLTYSRGSHPLHSQR